MDAGGHTGVPSRPLLAEAGRILRDVSLTCRLTYCLPPAGLCTHPVAPGGAADRTGDTTESMTQDGVLTQDLPPDSRPVPRERRAGALAALAAPLAACLALLACALGAPSGTLHAAPLVRPWTPPDADSLLIWGADAVTRFQTNQGDSVGGSNFHAYELVGMMGRRLLRSLGRSGMNQAHAVEAVLDSMGLDTEIATDPRFPTFVLLMVHNPYRRTATSVGFLYWLRDLDLRMQGVIFMGGRQPRMRVWWTGKSDVPYEWGVLTVDPADDGRMDLLFLRLNSDGTFWVLVQYGGEPYLGGPGEAEWADLNNDGKPELSVWTRTKADSLFEECPECPHLTSEQVYVEGPAGFELFDSRLFPTPYATFTLFIRLLRQQNRPAAARLLENPARVTDAVAQGWGSGRGRGLWKLEYGEEGQAWPRALEFLFKGPRGPVRYAVRFALRDGRWLISDWKVPRRVAAGKEVRP